jgi:hypothetical protein
MKKIFLVICFTLCIAFVNAQTVYIAETGKKYHTKNCPSLKNGKKEMQLKDAQKKGYKACPQCGADKIVPEKKKEVAKKKEEITQ